MLTDRRSYRGRTDCVAVPITDEQRTAARRTVAENAIDVADATELLKMLGLYPGQEVEDFKIFAPAIPPDRYPTTS